MISPPIFNNFVIQYDKKFLCEEVEKNFFTYFNKLNIPFMNLISYVNDSIVNFDIPEVSTIVQTQTNSGQNTSIGNTGSKRHYSGGLHTDASIEKRINIEHKLENNFFIYFLMRQNLRCYNDRWSKHLQWHLPRIYYKCLDDYGNCIWEAIYHDIVLEKVSQITVKKNDTMIQYKTFTVTLRYNKIEEFSVFDDSYERKHGIPQTQENLIKS